LPGDFISTIRRRGVLQALARHVAQLVCGDNWAKAEAEAEACNDAGKIAILKNGISKRSEERAVGVVLARDCGDLALFPCEERVKRIASLATKFRLLPSHSDGKTTDVVWLSEFALRLASDPVGVGAWAEKRLHDGLARLMDVPTIARAARFLVLATDYHLKSRTAPDELYAGWGWT
jgi:hypothetical protein